MSFFLFLYSKKCLLEQFPQGSTLFLENWMTSSAAVQHVIICCTAALVKNLAVPPKLKFLLAHLVKTSRNKTA